MEARFITDLAQLVSETQQRMLARLLFVDQRLSQQATALGDVVNAALPLLKATVLSEKTRSRELNALFTAAQQDLEILFADMATLSETLDRLSTLSDATLRALDQEAARIAVSLEQYRAKLFGRAGTQEVFRYVSAMTADNQQAAADLALWLSHTLDPAPLRVTRAAASFDQDLKGYTLAAKSTPLNAGDVTLQVVASHPNALPGDLSLATDPRPESAWKETLMVDSVLAGGAQCDLEVTFSSNRSINKIVVAPFNRTVIASMRLFVAPSASEESQPTFRGYPLFKDAEGNFYLEPFGASELAALSDENGVAFLDRSVPVRKIRMRLAQLHYTQRVAELSIQGLKPVPTALDAERALHDPQWDALRQAELAQTPISLNKYEYLYGLKDLRFSLVEYAPISRFISDPIQVDQPLSTLYLSTKETVTWTDRAEDAFAIFDEADGTFADELPLETCVDYRVRVLDAAMLDDPARYLAGLEGILGSWAPLPILPQEHATRYGEWLYDWLQFRRADALAVNGETGAWVAPLATRPLNWASDPFGTTQPNDPITAALYRDGSLVRRGASGRVDQFRFLIEDETYGLHVAIPFSTLPAGMDIGALRLVAVYRPDPAYRDTVVTPSAAEPQAGSAVFTTSREQALVDANQSAVSASGATLVPAGTHELKLPYRVARHSTPVVSRRKLDGSYVPLFQQIDPRRPTLYRTAHRDVRLETLRFNGRPVDEVFGTMGEQDPETGHVTLDLAAYPQGGVLTYLYGPADLVVPKSATEIASVRRDFTLDGDRLVLSEPLKEGELLRVDYTYHRYALVLDARLQRFGTDASVTPALTSFSLGGDLA